LSTSDSGHDGATKRIATLRNSSPRCATPTNSHGHNVFNQPSEQRHQQSGQSAPLRLRRDL